MLTNGMLKLNRIKIMGGSGGPNPLKNHKNLGFLSNTGPDPLKNHKATKPEFNVGPLSAIGKPAKRRSAGGPMMAPV